MGHIQQHKKTAAKGPRLEFGFDVAAVIREHVEATYPEEACGGLLGSPDGDGGFRVSAAVPIENSRHGQRNRRYLIGPEDVLRLEKDAEASGLRVIGYYHSHPDAPAIPSDFDREHAWPWYTYLIVSVYARKSVDAQAWRLAENRTAFDRIQIAPVGITNRTDRRQ